MRICLTRLLIITCPCAFDYFYSGESAVDSFVYEISDGNSGTEPPLDVYGECVIRTATTNGIVMLTFTPLEGMSEVVMSFLPTEMQIQDGA